MISANCEVSVLHEIVVYLVLRKTPASSSKWVVFQKKEVKKVKLRNPFLEKKRPTSGFGCILGDLGVFQKNPTLWILGIFTSYDWAPIDNVHMNKISKNLQIYGVEVLQT